LSENTDDLFVGKTLLHGVVLMWLMKTLLTSRCINQRGAGHSTFTLFIWGNWKGWQAESAAGLSQKSSA
ncbi:hypothetical protein, partial [Klebsiella quasipneumoniae]|uniref:hypothetical protein n=1 Tax=Klebsiella quasipneumoniae TaxID=1463165 RepID=UPI0039E7CFF9